MYEVAKFGKIENGQYHSFFDTNTLSTTIFGDFYTQKRISTTGGFTCASYTPNEVSYKNVTHDLGRIAQIDRLGLTPFYPAL